MTMRHILKSIRTSAIRKSRKRGIIDQIRVEAFREMAMKMGTNPTLPDGVPSRFAELMKQRLGA